MYTCLKNALKVKSLIRQQVKLAIAHNIPLLATGARHGYTVTLARLQNGLAIDLSHFDSVRVNEQDETVTVGGAVKMRQVLDPVYDAGFELRKFISLRGPLDFAAFMFLQNPIYLT